MSKQKALKYLNAYLDQSLQKGEVWVDNYCYKIICENCKKTYKSIKKLPVPFVTKNGHTFNYSCHNCKKPINPTVQFAYKTNY